MQRLVWQGTDPPLYRLKRRDHVDLLGHARTWNEAREGYTPSIANLKPRTVWKSVRQWLEAMQQIPAA
jgi:hypothetical protein